MCAVGDADASSMLIRLVTHAMRGSFVVQMLAEVWMCLTAMGCRRGFIYTIVLKHASMGGSVMDLRAGGLDNGVL